MSGVLVYGSRLRDGACEHPVKIPRGTMRRLERLEEAAEWRTSLAAEPVLEVYGSVEEARASFHPDNADVLDLVERYLSSK